MKSFLLCCVVQLALFSVGTPSVYSQEEHVKFISPSKQLDVLSSYRMLMRQNELLKERLAALEEERNATNTNTTNTNTTNTETPLEQKLDAVSAQVQSNAKLLEMVVVQQEAIISQLAEDKKLNSSLLRHVRGFLMVDRFNSDSKWTVLKKGLVGLLNHSDAAYQQVEKLTGDDPMPMSDIVKNSDLQLLQILLDYGLYVDVQDSNTKDDTFLHLSALYSKQDMAQLLLERGANIDARNKDNATPLIVAASSNSLPILKLLTKKGAGVNDSDQVGRTALHYAAEKGFLDIVRYLVESGANTKIQDSTNLTALDVAVKAGQEEVVKFLSQFNRSTHIKS